MFRFLVLWAAVLALSPGASLAHGNEGHEATAAEAGNPADAGNPAEAGTSDDGTLLCPVTPEEPIDPTIFVDHDGERVYFCCKRCRMKFIEDPEAYAAHLPGEADLAGETGHAEGSAHAGHSHAEEAPPGTLPRLVRFAGKFHPVTVHFPIGLLITAFMAAFLAQLRPGPRFLEASRVLVLFAAPMAVVTAALGWAAGANSGYSGDLATVLTRHRWLGTVTAAGALITLIVSERYWRDPTPKRRLWFLVSLGGAALLVGLTGHFGGTLIHGPEHFKW